MNAGSQSHQPESAAPPQPTMPKLPDANPEMLRIVLEDQWDRGIDMFGARPIRPPDLHDKTVAQRDEERENAVRQLLDAGKLTSGTDFWLAALVFQHSIKPEGVLLAHVLAVTATAKGNINGKWLAAASLDRYLWDTNQPQVFGTQFKKDAEGKWTMEPYARKVVSDSERAMWCVAPIADQQRIFEEFQAGKPPSSTTLKDCP